MSAKNPILPTTWEDSKKFPPAAERPKVINHLGISGGKDSTRLLLWALFESGYPRETLDVSFCDTGNESPITYDYIRYLEETLQIGITWIHPGLKFFELAKSKKRFPSAKARFCTELLKIKPTLDYLNHWFSEGGRTVVLHSGVRAAESNARAKMLDREFDGNMLAEVYRPLLKMSIQEVWEGHYRYGVKPNPLYAMGMQRVGCFPCVMSRKREIQAINAMAENTWGRIREIEKAFPTTFFHAKSTPNRFHSKSYTNRKGKLLTAAVIDDVLAWSETGKGAKIDPRTMGELSLEYDRLPRIEDAGRCSSSIGYCE